MRHDQEEITALISFDCERDRVKRLYDGFRTTLERIALVSSARMPNRIPEAISSYLSDSNRHVFTVNHHGRDHDVNWLYGSHGRSMITVSEFGTTATPYRITLHGDMERDPSGPASPPDRGLSCTAAIERLHDIARLLSNMLAARMHDDMPDETVDPVMGETLRLARAAAASRSARTGRPAYARGAGPFSGSGLFDEKPVLSVLQPSEYVPVLDATDMEMRFLDQPCTINAIIHEGDMTDIAPVSCYIDASKTDPIELLRMIEEGSR